jgi:hypothetical protein
MDEDQVFVPCVSEAPRDLIERTNKFNPYVAYFQENMPLCMVLSVSPLSALDNPQGSAADMLRRKKAREKRRAKRPSIKALES